MLIAIAPSIPRAVGACTIFLRGGDPHDLDAAYLDDRVAPGLVAAAYRIEYGRRGPCSGCDCPPAPGYLVLELSATDDRAPPEELGYKFEVVGGEAPSKLELGSPAIALRVSSYEEPGEMPFVYWGEDREFSFDLQITAVDLNGNEGPPVVITIDG